MLVGNYSYLTGSSGTLVGKISTLISCIKEKCNREVRLHKKYLWSIRISLDENRFFLFGVFVIIYYKRMLCINYNF